VVESSAATFHLQLIEEYLFVHQRVDQGTEPWPEKNPEEIIRISQEVFDAPF
jgi:hypothetical protein